MTTCPKPRCGGLLAVDPASDGDEYVCLTCSTRLYGVAPSFEGRDVDPLFCRAGCGARVYSNGRTDVNSKLCQECTAARWLQKYYEPTPRTHRMLS